MNVKGKISKKALTAGWLVDIIGHSLIAGMVVPLATGIIFWFYLRETPLNPGELDEIVARWSDSIGFKVFDIFGSLLPPMFAGYVAASMAKTGELRHALIVGVLSVLTAIIFGHTVTRLGLITQSLTWSDVVSWFLYLPSALFGGYLKSRRKERQNEGQRRESG